MVTYKNGQPVKTDDCCVLPMCDEPPELCGAPPPPCEPKCGTKVHMTCAPAPTRDAIKLQSGEVGRWFNLSPTMSSQFFAVRHKMSLTLKKAGSVSCREYCLAPSGVNKKGQVYFAWSQDFYKADAGYYLATITIDGFTAVQYVLYKPFAFVNMHFSFPVYAECGDDCDAGISVPRKGCGCYVDTCCTHLPEPIQEEFIPEPVNCGGCDDCD